MERFVRNGKPVPMSAQLAANFALLGGAGVQGGESEGVIYFDRGGLGCNDDALLSSDVCPTL